MSRSSRKPVWSQGYGSKVKKQSKRSASKVIRNLKESEEVPSGNQYKKYFNSWDICDFKFFDPKNPKVRRK